MLTHRSLLWAAATILTPFVLATGDLSSSCSSAAISKPVLFGVEILSITANPSFDQSNPPPILHLSSPVQTDALISFCNVTVTYTHPGQEDRITTSVFLPLEGWNNRLLGLGGGGYATRLPGDGDLLKGVAGGYAAVTTDGGHDPSLMTVETWALNSPGNVDLYALNNFAHVSLFETSGIGKAIASSFYKSEPTFSYFAGCSSGGRQAMMLAQRYPTAYDGYLSGCPAMNWNKLNMAEIWSYVAMKTASSPVPACILDKISAAAVEACDGLDGVVDGIIDDYRKCKFSPHETVGQKVDCGNSEGFISSEAADVVQSLWDGPRSANGEFLWYGFTPGSQLTMVANSQCDADNKCTAVPFPLATEWVKFFLKKDPDYDISSITLDDFYDLFHESQHWYQSIIGTDDPNLFGLKRSGGKMITWHGTVDPLIPVGGTSDYYDRVFAMDPKVDEYFRHFEAPGVAHCFGGPGALPKTALDTLVRWVEEDVAPDSLLGEMVDPESNKTTYRDHPAYHLLQREERIEVLQREREL
ncbi:Tannase feruloyl esterase [Penicillium pulvis]|uniref:Tannase feruloyl esterase n=1 Tax=Penicillium pulvis TaxID=1562058 RepID=UPI002548C20E|nr:Tannase feruloyl esterase [Penicillium pulvis]KAJ5798091.1 Tannase feruloyl esterase [Penicillium pulvis]